MNDKKPASLSSDLLARKGEAQPFSIDPSERMTPYLSAESGGSHFGGGPQFDVNSTADERAFPPEPDIIFTPEELEEGSGRGKLIALVVGGILVLGGIVFAISFQSGDRGVAPVAPALVAQAPTDNSTAANELRSTATATSEAAPVIAPPQTSAPADAAGAEDTPPVTETPAAPVAAAKPIETAKIAPIETKPVVVVEKPAVAKPLAVKPVAATPAVTAKAVSGGGVYVVQLLALRDEAAVKKAWATLQKKHPSLRSHASDIERADLGAKGVYYRLRASGFSSKAEAASFCTELKAAGQDCMAKAR